MDSMMKTDDNKNAEIENSFFRERFHFIVVYQFNVEYVNITMRWYSFLFESLSQVFSYEEMRLSWVSVYTHKHPTDEMWKTDAVGRRSAWWDSLCGLLRWMSAPSPPDPFATLPSSCSVPPEAEFCGAHQWATWCPDVSYRELRRMWARRRRVRSESWCWELPPGGSQLLLRTSGPSFPQLLRPLTSSAPKSQPWKLHHPPGPPRAWAHFCKVLFIGLSSNCLHLNMSSLFARNWYPVCLKPLCAQTQISLQHSF